jgi:uncharacterized repeat protein (TIGR02059 family)
VKSITLIRSLGIVVSTLLVSFFVHPLSASAAGPTLQSATVEAYSGRTISLVFDDLSGTTTQPTRTDFSVAGTVQGSITVSSVFKSGSTIRVSVSTVVAGGQTVTLTYTPSTNILTNASSEPLGGFSTQLAHPGATAIPGISTDELFVNWANPSQILTYVYVSSGGSLICALTSANFQIKVNGTLRAISSISGSDCTGTLRVNLSSPLAANDQVTFSYIPSPGAITSIYGTPAAALTDAKVTGVPDTIAPTITLPSVATYQFGLGGSISLSSNETVNWQVTSDRTLSFQIFGTPQQLLVSSILPVGSYTVGVSASDDAGNVTTRNITVNITALAPSPTPTPVATPLPKPSSPAPTKAVVFKTCVLLNKKYPGGVATSYSARNKGAGMNYIPRVDAAAYKANIKLDKDKDGIACER